MIMDTLNQAARYAMWLPRLQAGFEFLIRQANADLADGRYEIDSDRMFALVQHYTTRGYGDTEPESHRRYIDLQYLITGRETIYWTPLDEIGPVAKPYDKEKDITFYGRNGNSRPFELSAGHFCLLFPEDAHQPGCHAGQPGPIHKAVIKIAVA